LVRPLHINVVALAESNLGDSLWHVLDLLRTDKNAFPKVEVSWNPDVLSLVACRILLLI
jgi:hypothetical protein